MSAPAAPASTAPAAPTIGRVAVGVVAAMVVASVVNVVVAAVAHAAGASDDFAPLMPPAFISFTVIGALAGTAGWALIRRGDRAASALRWLVPAVLVVSLVPDLLVGMGQTMAGTSWTAIVGLMVMHVVVAAALVGVLLRVLPVRDREPATSAA